MLNFFLPMAICLFLCVVLLHMEKGERKKKKAILNYSSTTEQFLDKFNLYFDYFKFSITTKLGHSLCVRGKSRLLFTATSNDCSSELLIISWTVSNTAFCSTCSPPEQMTNLNGIKSNLWLFVTDRTKVTKGLFSIIPTFIFCSWNSCFKELMNHVCMLPLLTFLPH